MTVDATRLVTAAGHGIAGVPVSAGPAVGSAAVTLRPAPAAFSVSLLPDSPGFRAAGDTVTLMAAVAGSNRHPTDGVQLRWASRDAAVAGVDTVGLVTTVATGRTEVTAGAGGREASAAATIAICAVSISLDRIELSFTVLGNTPTLTATAVDRQGRAGGGTVESSSWSVSSLPPSGCG